MLADQEHLYFIEYLRSNLGNSHRRHWLHRTALRHIHQAALKWERKIKWIFRNDPDPNRWQPYIDILGDYNLRYYRLLERTPTLVFLNVRKKSTLKERATRKIPYDQIGSSIPMEAIYGRLLQKRQNDHVYSYDPRVMEAPIHRSRNMVPSGRNLPHKPSGCTKLHMRSYEVGIPDTYPSSRSHHSRH